MKPIGEPRKNTVSISRIIVKFLNKKFKNKKDITKGVVVPAQMAPMGSYIGMFVPQ